jgi:hypothetical protein
MLRMHRIFLFALLLTVVTSSAVHAQSGEATITRQLEQLAREQDPLQGRMQGQGTQGHGRGDGHDGDSRLDARVRMGVEPGPSRQQRLESGQQEKRRQQSDDRPLVGSMQIAVQTAQKRAHAEKVGGQVR